MQRMAVSIERLALIRAKDGRTHVTLQGHSLCSPEMKLDNPVIICGPDAVEQASCPECKRAGKMLCSEHADEGIEGSRAEKIRMMRRRDAGSYYGFWTLLWLGALFTWVGWTTLGPALLIWACILRLRFLYLQHQAKRKLKPRC